MQKRPMKSTKSGAAGTFVQKNKTLNKGDDYDSESFQQQALLVRQPGENFDPSIEPQSGEEYLMKMLYERKRCPTVVVKRPKKLVSNETADSAGMANMMETDLLMSLPKTPKPTPEWKAIQVADFIDMREKISDLRLELTAQNYKNELEPPLVNDVAKWHQFCQQNQPLLSTILRINQRVLEKLLEMMCDWLREGADPTAFEKMSDDEEEFCENVDRVARMNEQESVGSITTSMDGPVPSTTTSLGEEAEPSSSGTTVANSTAATLSIDLSTSEQWLGSWLYAALACLHLPLEPNVHSTLREIARSCIRLRSCLLEHEEYKAVPFNLFIYLIAKVFDQLDFADCV